MALKVCSNCSEPAQVNYDPKQTTKGKSSTASGGANFKVRCSADESGCHTTRWYYTETEAVVDWEANN